MKQVALKKSPAPSPAAALAQPESPFHNPHLARAYCFLARDVWQVDLDRQPWYRAWAYKSGRVLFLTAREFVDDSCIFRASALTYITVLSLVPLFAFAFSVAKGFGAYERVVPALEGWISRELSPSEPGIAPSQNAQAVMEAVHRLLGFVESTDVRSLGLAGLAFLLLTVIKLLGTVENTFNDIWGVRRPRSLVRKVSDYLAMVVIVPIFLVSAIGVTSVSQFQSVVTFVSEKLYMRGLIEFLTNFASLFAIWAGFTLMYLTMPNTRTRLKSAVLGGLVGGTLWHLAQLTHVKFQIGMARYNAIYAGFAAIPIFLAWLHVSWVTVLVGAELACAHQSEPAYRQIAQSRPADQAVREVVALRALVRIGSLFLRGERALSAAEIASQLAMPIRTVEEVLGILVQRGLLAESSTASGEGFVPARDLGGVTVKMVLDALKGTTGPVDVPPRGRLDEELDRLLAELERALASSPANRTLRELAQEAQADSIPAAPKVEERAACDAAPRQA